MKITKQILDLSEERIGKTNGSTLAWEMWGNEGINLLVTIFSGEPYRGYFIYLTYPLTHFCSLILLVNIVYELLCARHCFRYWDTSFNRADLVFSSLSVQSGETPLDLKQCFL